MGRLKKVNLGCDLLNSEFKFTGENKMVWEEIEKTRKGGGGEIIDCSYVKLSPEKDEKENKSTLNLTQEDCEKLGWKPGVFVKYMIDRESKKIALKQVKEGGYKLGHNIKQLKSDSKVKMCISTNLQVVEAIRAMWPVGSNDKTVKVMLKTEVIAINGMALLALSFNGNHSN